MPARLGCWVHVLGWVLGLAAISSAAEDRATILDENCYMRRYYRFALSRYSPAILKAEGQKVLGDARLDRTRREVEKAMQQRGLDPAKVDWRDHAYQSTREAYSPVPAAPPPDDWAALDFDDAVWVRGAVRFRAQGRCDHHAQSRPIQRRCGHAPSAGLLPRAVCHRRPEAGRAADAEGGVYGRRARVSQRQGDRRGHLPAGQLGADAPAENYAADDYKKAEPPDRLLGPINIPADRLVAGVNVLAIEIRASDFHPIVLTNAIQANWGGPQRPWPHARLTFFQLEANRAAAAKPADKAVAWVEDINHRVTSDELLPPGEKPGTIRFVGAKNGTYAAQVVVSSSMRLNALTAAPTPLNRDGGGEIPAPTCRQMAGFPAKSWTMRVLGDERGLGVTFPNEADLLRSYDTDQLLVYDRITGSLPSQSVRFCPIWLSLRVPASAAAGHYRGAVSIMNGKTPIAEVPVEADIADWTLPDPKHFQTFVGCEQNPYGIQRQYTLMGDIMLPEYRRLLAASFAQLGRIGNKWLNIPILANTEFGNGGSSLIVWKPVAQGFDFDYSALDRYLDTAIKHCGKPRVVQFVVMQGMPTGDAPARVIVPILDKDRPVAQDFGAHTLLRPAWQAFAKSLYAHMKEKGLEKAMYWGAPLEAEADPKLKEILAEAVPDVYWTAGPHEMMFNGTFAKNDKYYKVITDIRYAGGWPGFRMDTGWKSKTTHLLNPRVGGTIFAMHTTSHPFAYRVLPGRCIAMGRNGFTRLGADEWAGVHYSGMAIPRWLTGMPVLFMLWPAADGVDSGAVRVPAGRHPGGRGASLHRTGHRRRQAPAGPVAARRKTLADDLAETSFFQSNSIIHCLEEYHYRWQERSARLYQLAAEVSAAIGK